MEELAKKISQYSIKELRAICQATAPNPARESKVGKFSRVFSIYFTKLLLYTNVPPPVILTTSVVVFFAGVGLLMFNQYNTNLIGVAVVFLSIILDGTDGELARARQQTSIAAGMYGEPVSHDFQYGFAFLLVAIGLHLHGAPSWILMIGALASITKLLFRLLEIRFWEVFHGHKSEHELNSMKQSYASLSIGKRFGYWVNKNFFSSTGVFLIVLLTVLINRLDLFIWFFAIGYSFMLLFLFIKQIYTILQQKPD